MKCLRRAAIYLRYITLFYFPFQPFHFDGMNSFPQAGVSNFAVLRGFALIRENTCFMAYCFRSSTCRRMAKRVRLAVKNFAVFNVLNLCYKNFNGITSIINDTTNLSIALQNRHFRRKTKKFALKSCRFARTRAIYVIDLIYN